MLPVDRKKNRNSIKLVDIIHLRSDSDEYRQHSRQQAGDEQDVDAIVNSVARIASIRVASINARFGRHALLDVFGRVVLAAGLCVDRCTTASEPYDDTCAKRKTNRCPD